MELVEADNKRISEIVGSTGENLEVLQSGSKELAALETERDEDKGPDGEVYQPGGSGSIATAARSQEVLEEQQASYEDLLAQIEEERDRVNEDV
jgi:hypothetical protein